MLFLKLPHFDLKEVKEMVTPIAEMEKMRTREGLGKKYSKQGLKKW